MEKKITKGKKIILKIIKNNELRIPEPLNNITVLRVS